MNLPSLHLSIVRGLRQGCASGAIVLVLLFHGGFVVGADELSASFDQANKLYEEGKFAEAAGAYEKLIAGKRGSPTLYFNLGNALFKTGKLGRAVVWYRRAEALAPRDPDIKANLQYLRKSVQGGSVRTNWRARLRALSLNEWTALTAAAGWLWFALLSWREFRPNFRTALRGYTATAGVVAGVFATALTVVWLDQIQTQPAVVVVGEVVVRRGPLEESQSYFNLRHGAEVSVLDQKDRWLQVSDEANRVGWLRREQIEFVRDARAIAAIPAQGG